MRESHELVILRPAVPEDAPAIAATHITSWRSTYPGIIPQTYLDSLNHDEFTERWHMRLTQEPEMLIRVADQEGSICGFAAAGRSRGTVADFAGELYAIYLLKAAQGQGIGSRLFRSMAEALTSLGLNSMFVWVLERNPSCRFYERMGGTRASEMTVEIGGRTLTEVAYGWSALVGSSEADGSPAT